jgi:hypothetical protein
LEFHVPAGAQLALTARVLSPSPRLLRGAWLLLLAALALIGLAQMRGQIAGLPPNRAGADATSEAIFASWANEREVPRRLAAEIAKLPPERPLLVLQPRDNFFTSLPSYLIAYEASPRPVVIRERQVADSPNAVAELRRHFAAVIFIGQAAPAAFPPGKKFGEAICFVPLEGGRSWDRPIVARAP